MSSVKNSTVSIKTDGTTLEASLLDMRNKIAATKAQTGSCLTSCQALDQTLLTMEVNYDLVINSLPPSLFLNLIFAFQLPDITTNLIALRAVQTQDLAAITDQVLFLD